MSRIDVQLVREGRQWWHDTSEFAAVGRWLEETGEIRDPWEFVEKPWKFSDAREQFLREEALEAMHDAMNADGDETEWRAL